jgi:hypothetical protein
VVKEVGSKEAKADQKVMQHPAFGSSKFFGVDEQEGFHET